MEEPGKVLHIVMFPWLAIGHLKPFFRLSKCLARNGHRISFISTPRNLQRIANIPRDLAHLINLISLPLPEVEHLPPDAESSMDVPHVKQQLLKTALDLLEPSVRSFLENTEPKPDWIVYDYASHWLPQMAAEIGISRAFFSLFTAAFMAFLGPPAALMSGESARSTAEDYTVVPEWIPFPSNMAFRVHEMTKNMEKGRIVYQKLKEKSDEYVTRGLVRTEESKETIGGAYDIYVADIRNAENLIPVFQGVNVLIILTSAVPKMKGEGLTFILKMEHILNRWT